MILAGTINEIFDLHNQCNQAIKFKKELLQSFTNHLKESFHEMILA